MSMFTRCAHCESIFQVTLAQLQLAGGQVRCGVCQEVFDAFVSLSARDPRLPSTALAPAAATGDDGDSGAGRPDGPDGPDGRDDSSQAEAAVRMDAVEAAVEAAEETTGEVAASAEAAAGPTETQLPDAIGAPVDDGLVEPIVAAAAGIDAVSAEASDAESRDSTERVDADDSEPAWYDPGIADARFPAEELPEIVFDGESPVPPIDDHASPALPAMDERPDPAIDTSPGDATPSASGEDPDPDAVDAPEAVVAPQPVLAHGVPRFALPRPDRTPASLVAGIVLMSALVLLQAAYLMRASIAEAAPALRPPLETACRWLHCAVPLPRLTDRLSIEASELQALDPLHPNLVTFIATIRNRAPVEQALPLLELTLTDAREEVVARKIFRPIEYLTIPPAGPGVAANAELAVRLGLDTADIIATGYRLYLFHP